MSASVRCANNELTAIRYNYIYIYMLVVKAGASTSAGNTAHSAVFSSLSPRLCVAFTSASPAQTVALHSSLLVSTIIYMQPDPGENGGVALSVRTPIDFRR